MRQRHRKPLDIEKVKMSADGFGNVMVVVVSLMAIGLLVLYVGSLAWIYRDSEARSKTGCLWLLIVYVTWPLGALAYLLLRDRRVQL